jgi:cobalt-zinc-cadmium efflux system protein
MGHENRSAAGCDPVGREEQKRRVLNALAVTASFLVVEVVGGFVSGSLALLADATHMFADVGALLLAYAAMGLAARPPSARYSFGFYRAEILAAFVNAQILVVLSGGLLYEAYRRFHAPREIAAGIMMAVAAGGFVANLTAMRLLGGGRETSINVRAAYVEVLADALASAGVVIASVVVAATAWYWVDPLVSGAVGVLVLSRTVPLLRESTHILLEGTPLDMDVEALAREIAAIPGVQEVHDLHVWTLTSGLHTATLHVRVEDHGRGGTALAAVQRVLRERAGVEHATIQVERGTGEGCETAELRF